VLTVRFINIRRDRKHGERYASNVMQPDVLSVEVYGLWTIEGTLMEHDAEHILEMGRTVLP